MSDKIRFKLRRPCAECPFKKTTPLHRGVALNLDTLAESLRDETFAHSCHRTDSRSDYRQAKRYRGEIQHCAGALIMMEKSGCVSLPMANAMAFGELDVKRLDMAAPVYTVYEFLTIYIDWMKSPNFGDQEESL